MKFSVTSVTTSAAVAAILCGSIGPARVSAQTTTADPDPWNAVQYSIDSSGAFVKPSPDAALANGISLEEGSECTVSGHAVVIHDPIGTRIGCGLIGEDPWVATTITSDGSGNVSQTVTVAGYGIDDSAVSTMTSDSTSYNAFGRVIVVHDDNGERIACGCCVDEDTAVSLGTYPGYTGSVSVTGTVTTSTDSNPATISLQANLEGYGTSMTGGIHIHTGTSCSDADDVGGHFFEPGVAIIGAYPDYQGNYSVSGTASASNSPGSTVGVLFSAYLNDDTGNSFTSGESGGAHIHVGTTCSVASEVGGHYYDICSYTTTTTTTIMMSNIATVSTMTTLFVGLTGLLLAQ